MAGGRAIPFIHAVTNSATVARRDFLTRAEHVMRALGSFGAIHLRSSRVSGRRFHELATLLSDLQEKTGCWLIVNDRVDIAAAVGAWGIQLASHSLRVPEARSVAPNAPIGISVHTVEEAVEAQAAGASWCVAGTVFETPSHEGHEGSRIPFIQSVSDATTIPVIAIGGIQPEHIAALRAAGAYGVATIRGAGWDRPPFSKDTDPFPGKTRLSTASTSDAEEPVTRYISAYDWNSGRRGEHHSDSKRRDPGDSAE